jgi:hypothetical protein
MDDISSMRKRVAYLKRQARELRKLGKFSRDETVRGQFLELADRCDAIVCNITNNIPIHRRFRGFKQAESGI